MPSEQVLRSETGFESDDILPLISPLSRILLSDAKLDALEAFVRRRRGGAFIEKVLQSGFCPEHAPDPIDVPTAAARANRADITSEEYAPKRRGRPPGSGARCVISPGSAVSISPPPPKPSPAAVQKASLSLSVGRDVSICGPVVITKAELDRICGWLAAQFIVEP